MPFPDSVRSLIAARLDTLAPDAKSLLAARRGGRERCSGPVRLPEMGGRDPDEGIETLRECLARSWYAPTALPRCRARPSTPSGTSSPATWPTTQLPRASRAARHVAAALVESQAPERVEDLAAVLAYHYATALELAHVIRRPIRRRTLEESARRFLALAGERALGLDTDGCSRESRTSIGAHAGRALRSRGGALLRPAGQPRRSHGRGEAGTGGGDPGTWPARRPACQARAMHTLNIVLLLPSGDAGQICPRRHSPCWNRSQPAPPWSKHSPRLPAWRGSRPHDTAIRSAERALTLADDLGLAHPARALGFRGR